MTAYTPPSRSWLTKFADAARGVVQGMRGECSFLIHLPIAVLVIIVAVVLRVSWQEAGLLALCIAGVLTAELFNSALERLARAIAPSYREEVRVGLNVASGAVLCAACGAAVCGALIFAPRVVALLSDSWK